MVTRKEPGWALENAGAVKALAPAVLNPILEQALSATDALLATNLAHGAHCFCDSCEALRAGQAKIEPLGRITGPTIGGMPSDPGVARKSSFLIQRTMQCVTRTDGTIDVSCGTQFVGTAKTPKELWALMERGLPTLTETIPTKARGKAPTREEQEAFLAGKAEKQAEALDQLKTLLGIS